MFDWGGEGLGRRILREPKHVPTYFAPLWVRDAQ